MNKKILITGAGGLLGRALVELFLEKEFFVLGQYHTKKPAQVKNCEWLQADFSTLAGMRTFLKKNDSQIKGCRYLINNYGPVTYKETAALTSEDFQHDFFHNVITTVEITNFLIEYTAIESVVNIGFEFAGIIKPYKKILSYAAAKNALLLITKSYAGAYQHIRFNMVCPPTLEGADVALKKGKIISPKKVASEIFTLLTTGTN